MKNIILFLLVLASGKVFAGAVGGGGTSGLQRKSIAEIMAVYSGANNLSRSTFGNDNQFNIDFQNRVIVFDPNLTKLNKPEVLSFDEVAKFADPAVSKAQEQ